MSNDCTTVDNEVYMKAENVISLFIEEQVEEVNTVGSRGGSKEDSANHMCQATLLRVLRSLTQTKVMK